MVEAGWETFETAFLEVEQAESKIKTASHIILMIQNFARKCSNKQRHCYLGCFWNFICTKNRNEINMAEQTFEIVVSGVPYMIKANPYEFNTETRYLVSYNGGDEHVFTWDSSLGRMTAIDDDAGTIPDDLEVAIAERLQSTKV